jgi:protein SCO1
MKKLLRIKLHSFIFLTATAILLISCSKSLSKQNADLPPGGDFTLTDHNGKSFSTQSLRGKTVLVYFGYTLCPDACPLTMSRLRSVFNILGEPANDVVILFVSVDPDRDSPEHLKKYLSQFKLNTIGLTGSAADIRKAADLYKVYYKFVDSGSQAGYLVDHTTLVFLVDKSGKLRYQFRHSDPVELMASIIKLLL